MRCVSSPRQRGCYQARRQAISGSGPDRCARLWGYASAWLTAQMRTPAPRRLLDSPGRSGFAAPRHMGVPGMAGFRLYVGEAGARRWIGNADKMLTGWALNLSARVARVTLQRLIAMGTIEFEFRWAHRFHPHPAQNGHQKYARSLFILLTERMCM